LGGFWPIVDLLPATLRFSAEDWEQKLTSITVALLQISAFGTDQIKNQAKCIKYSPASRSYQLR
jgi:hypothetical protein